MIFHSNSSRNIQNFGTISRTFYTVCICIFFYMSTCSLVSCPMNQSLTGKNIAVVSVPLLKARVVMTCHSAFTTTAIPGCTGNIKHTIGFRETEAGYHHHTVLHRSYITGSGTDSQSRNVVAKRKQTHSLDERIQLID